MAATFVGEYNFPETENQNDTGTTLTLATAALEDTQALATGDLVYMFATFRATTGTMSITTTGGQTWTEHINAIDGFLFGVWSCVFDGTWDADPVITYSGSASPRILRANAWTDHDGWSIAPTNDGDPGGGDQTFAFDTNNDGDVAILGGGQSDNNTGTVDNGFTAPPGSGNMYHRSAGGADFSTGLAVKEIATAGPIGTTTFDWAANESLGIEWHAAIKPAVTTPTAPAMGRIHVRGTASAVKRGIAAAVGRIKMRGTAAGVAIKSAAAVGRVHVRGTARGAQFGSAPAHGRMHVRGSAFGSPFASAPGTGRMHVRASATGFKIGVASASGRMHLWGTATGQEVAGALSAAAVGRMHVRATATGFKIGIAPAVGRVHFRGLASGMKIGVAPAIGRMHVWGRATGAEPQLEFASAVGRMHMWGRATGGEFVEPEVFHPEMVVRRLYDPRLPGSTLGPARPFPPKKGRRRW